jgi:hypothetical protein
LTEIEKAFAEEHLWIASQIEALAIAENFFGIPDYVGKVKVHIMMERMAEMKDESSGLHHALRNLAACLDEADWMDSTEVSE